MMSFELVIDLARGAMMLAVQLAGPLLLVALVVGLIVSLIQAITQIQEQTMPFVAKLAAVGIAFLIVLNWMLQTAVRYTVELFRSLPSLAM